MEPSLSITDACIGCGLCAKVCIRGHLEVRERRATEVESPYGCFRCGHCASVCPKGAITLLGAGRIVPFSGCPVSAEDMEALYRTRRSMRWFDRKCTPEELERLIQSAGCSPTAENSQKVAFAVVDESFPEFMELLASILRSHTKEHPSLAQFVDYVEAGQQGTNNPFTWEGRQVIIAFARFPIDAAIAMEQIDLMAYAMGLGGFHSRWMLQASENDPKRFMSFFPGIPEGLTAYAVYIVGHPRVKYRRTAYRDPRPVLWLRIRIQQPVLLDFFYYYDTFK